MKLAIINTICDVLLLFWVIPVTLLTIWQRMLPESAPSSYWEGYSTTILITWVVFLFHQIFREKPKP